MMPHREDGSVVVVTGASRGIGHALAQILVSGGSRLVLAVRSAVSVNALGKEFGASALVVQVDVAAAGAAETVLRAGLDHWGPIGRAGEQCRCD